MTARYVWLETLRQLRNVRSVMFTLGFPIVFLLIFGSAYGGHGQGAVNEPGTHLPIIVVTTLQMAAYGAIMAAMSLAFTIVHERSLGWNRHLRVTPLSGSGYLVSKTISALGLALVSVVLVIGVSVAVFSPPASVAGWLGAAVGLWLGATPFVLIGILIGQIAKPEFAQGLFMVVFLGMSLLGGLWIPLEILPSWMTGVATALPSYWLNQLGQSGIRQGTNPLPAIGVLLAWTVVIAALVVVRYRRDTARI